MVKLFNISIGTFGEVFLEEKNAKWNTPYLFTSKELDKETGMYYFGARYQDPKLWIFISVDPLAEKIPSWSSYSYAFNNPIRFIDPDGRMTGPGDGLGPEGVPPGEIVAKKTTTIFLKPNENGKGIQVMAPDGKYHNFDSKLSKYTYADGKTHNGQQKKAGVWSVTNKEGNFMWNNAKGKFVLNTFDRGGAENSFPLVGKAGTTYAGSDNPKNINYSNEDDYSQPPQNIADFGGFLHDKAFDNSKIRGFEGVLSPQSTNANNLLIDFSKQVQAMYNSKKIDPFTGAPVSKMTYDAATKMIEAFVPIEIGK